MNGPVVLAPDALDALIAALGARGYTVVGPVVRDGAVMLDEVRGRADLAVGRGDEQEPGRYRLVDRGDDALFAYSVGPQSIRRYLTPPRRRLFSAARSDGGMVVEEEPRPTTRYAFLGVRACDLAALAVHEHVLQADAHFAALRAQAFMVAVNCSHPASVCFCASMGTGPSVDTGFDIALTELWEPHRLLASAGSDRGASLLAELPGTAATDDDLAAAAAVVRDAAARQTRSLDPAAARDVLAANLDHPHWEAVAERCLSCTNCTIVCPTCFCSSVEDATSLDGTRAERVQTWASCFELDHSYLHGAGPVRADTRARYRQWLTHKLSTWWDQFGESGCVGCGRCITWCPAGIDLTEEVRAFEVHT